MSAAWLLYYAMLAAHIVGGGYALVRGRAAHRAAVLIIFAGVALQLSLCALSGRLGYALPSVCVVIDMIDNAAMCSAFLYMAPKMRQEIWLLALILLQSAELAIDGLVFGAQTHAPYARFADVSNTLNIFMLLTIASAAALSRRKYLATASPG